MSDGSAFPPLPGPPTFPPPGGRSGPAWERDGTFVQRYVDTARAALTDPKGFFSTMRLSGGLGPPITYALVGVGIGALASAVWSSFSSFGSYSSFPGAGMGGGGFVGMFVMTLVFGVVGLFIGAGIFHLMLSLLGAARQPFEATLRVVAYAAGSTALIGLVPICGSIVGAVYGLVLYIVGLSAAHECDTAKSAIAVLTPAVVCCVLFVLLWSAILALVFGAAAAGMTGASMP